MKLLQLLMYKLGFISKEAIEYRAQAAEFYKVLATIGELGRQWEYSMETLWDFAPNEYERALARESWEKLRLVWRKQREESAKVRWRDEFIALTIKGNTK